jgi:NAD(P)-dependent dehydrogenase (short-subunit alcohol dehydrogenase family)
VRFDGRSAVVVGGATGQGRSCALRLARDGAAVLVVDADADACAAVCAEIEAFGGTARWEQADPGDASALQRVAVELDESGADVDVLVNNFMMLDWSYIEDCDIEVFARVVQFNLVGPVASTKAFLPLLKRSAHASVVHLGSFDGLFGNPRVPSYSASKGGYVPLTHVMAQEFAKYDIRVNAIASGQTNQVHGADVVAAGTAPTGLGPSWPGPEYHDQLSAETPLHRFGTGEEWAGAAAFLASDDASYVTGTVLVVDCGRTSITHGTR